MAKVNDGGLEVSGYAVNQGYATLLPCSLSRRQAAIRYDWAAQQIVHSAWNSVASWPNFCHDFDHWRSV